MEIGDFPNLSLHRLRQPAGICGFAPPAFLICSIGVTVAGLKAPFPLYDPLSISEAKFIVGELPFYGPLSYGESPL